MEQTTIMEKIYSTNVLLHSLVFNFQVKEKPIRQNRATKTIGQTVELNRVSETISGHGKK